MDIDERLKELGNDGDSNGLISGFLNNSFKKFSSFAQFENEYVAGLVIVDLKKTGDVGVIKVDHDGHLFEQFFMFFFA